MCSNDQIANLKTQSLTGVVREITILKSVGCDKILNLTPSRRGKIGFYEIATLFCVHHSRIAFLSIISRSLDTQNRGHQKRMNLIQQNLYFNREGSCYIVHFVEIQNSYDFLQFYGPLKREACIWSKFWYIRNS